MTKNHCAICGQRLNLLESTINKCVCAHFFCNRHRFPEDHQCTFDHKAEQKRQLTRENPTIATPKITPI